MRKQLCAALTICVFCVGASAPAWATIYVMGSSEFKTIQHNKGRWEYVKRIAPLLKKLGIKKADYDATKSDYHDLYEAIQSAHWDEVVAVINGACKNPSQATTCSKLQSARMEIFDYIKNNPESFE